MSDLAQHINIMDLVTTASTLKRVGSTRGGEYAGACPFCGGEDRFHVWPQDNTWSCRQCVDASMTPKDAIDYVQRRDGVDFHDACNRLGIDLETGDHKTPGGYQNGQAYAAAHGLDWEDLDKCGWKEVVYKDRPALEFNTKGGKRWRFLDGDKPKYISEYGFTRTWYGLDDKVIQKAKDTNSPLFLCNGETSMIAARFHGVPAITVAGGGEKKLPDDLLKELQEKWQGRIAIAMDCDITGRKAAQDIQEQLGVQGAIVDLDMQDGQDLADFVALHGSWSLKRLKALVPLPVNAPVSSREAAARSTANLDINAPVVGKPLIMPYMIYHEYGGYALVCMPGKLSCVAAPSGHGKTSHLNTAIDTLLRDGEHGIGIMPEFDEEEYNWDRIQRYSGFEGMPFIPAETMMLWKLARAEHQKSIPQYKRKGHVLTKDEQRTVTHINNMVESWPGAFTLYAMGTTLEDSFVEMGDHIMSKRGTDEEVTFAAFDYIQILEAKSYPDDDNVYEYVMGLIKKFVMQYKIHGFVTSQVNKTADKNVRDGGKVLSSFDMRYVRDDKVNFLVTLNPVYDEITGQLARIPNTDGYAAIANIVKNSKGRTGQVYQVWDKKRLTFLDQSYTPIEHELNDDKQFKPVDLSNL